MSGSLHIVGDGIAGLLAARELTRRGRTVHLWGDRTAWDDHATTLVHRHAGRSFRTDAVEDVVWSAATVFLEELCAAGVAREFQMLRPVSDRLSRSVTAAPPDSEISREQHSRFGDVFRYGPAYAINVSAALTYLHSSLTTNKITSHTRRVEPDELEGDVVLACGAALPGYLPDADLRVFGGHLITFDGELDRAVSGRGFHAVPADPGQVCVGSTWWEPADPMSDVEAEASLRESAEAGGVQLGRWVGTWRGLRCVHHPDRRPLVGQCGDARWVIGALGTRGWYWGAHLARLLAGAVCDSAAPSQALAVSRSLHRVG